MKSIGSAKVKRGKTQKGNRAKRLIVSLLFPTKTVHTQQIYSPNARKVRLSLAMIRGTHRRAGRHESYPLRQVGIKPGQKGLQRALNITQNGDLNTWVPGGHPNDHGHYLGCSSQLATSYTSLSCRLGKQSHGKSPKGSRYRKQVASSRT